MTLLLSTLAAVISTVVWYFCAHREEYRLSTLVWMFWGASLMWSVDAFMEIKEIGSAYFTPSTQDMINDAFLGASVIVLALCIWLIADPKHLFHASFNEKKEQGTIS